MYYVLVKAGVPVDVVTQMAMAKQRARELETPGSPVQIVPVVPTKGKAPEPESEGLVWLDRVVGPYNGD